MMRKRRKLQRRLLREGDCNLQAELIRVQITDINERLKQSVQDELSREEERAVKVVKLNTKFFYSYARKKKTSRAVIGPLMRNGELVCENEDMAELLQDHFTETWSKPFFPNVKETLAQWAGQAREREIGEVYVTREKIVESLKKLSERSAPGLDGVPAVLLRKCAESISYPLYILWRISFYSGIVPSSLKEGVITPIFKKGNKSDCGNYRPVALTSHIAKTFERIVAEELVAYLETEELLSANQHGFRKDRSCSSQLLQHHYSVLRMMEEGNDVDIVYLDFSKAFDKVDIGLLLYKLKALGIKDPLFTWIQDFLLGRRQRVAVNGHLSRWSTVVSGVPQGTVLGPILFLAHVTDIDVGITSTVSCFADGTRIVRAVPTRGEAALCRRTSGKCTLGQPIITWHLTMINSECSTTISLEGVLLQDFIILQREILLRTLPI